jgi:mRNA interferase MazF
VVTPFIGAVVLVPFPFSDLSASKLRPALILADAGRGDWILCQITSKPYTDDSAIELINDDFANGGLRLVSYVRPGKLFTSNISLMKTQAGLLKKEKLDRVVDAVIRLLRP